MSRSASPMPPPAPGAPKPPAFPTREYLKKADETPQQALDRFWKTFTSDRRGKPLTVLPQNDLAERLSKTQSKDVVLTETATASYDSAVTRCKATVASIVRECKRINQKYRDGHFDLENRRMCLQGLCVPGCDDYEPFPPSVFRVGDIFTDPHFFIDGVSANDVRQGRNGDCWFLAAVAALSGLKDLAEMNCVARDEVVGVYGFVFHRDGEWISEIVDDKLYLIKPNWNDWSLDRVFFDEIGRSGMNEAKYRKAFLTGSEALYFAQCREENETWLPLLEKAFAKAHGDYKAIDGGFTGEAIEDLTGGVTTEVRTADILDKKHFWQELLQCNKKFIFSCWTGTYHGGATSNTEGIVEGHAYSVQRAVEEAGEKLVLLHNPWGETEWTGPWSDGSAEWTAAWMERLDHKFGNDGVFWMSYTDLLRKFELFDRTRLFDAEWTSTQAWTSMTVPWKIDYHDTKFCFTLDKDDLVLVALSQLDDRYIRGLEGQYQFDLQFRLQKDDDPDCVVRSNTNYRMNRSVNTELSLEAGSYTVYVKITANRDKDLLSVEDVISKVSEGDREKLTQIGMKYDLAHTKREIRATEDELKIKADKEKERAKMEKAVTKMKKQKLKAKQKKARDKQKEKEKSKRTAQEKGTAAAATEPEKEGDKEKPEEKGVAATEPEKDEVKETPEEKAAAITEPKKEEGKETAEKKATATEAESESESKRGEEAPALIIDNKSSEPGRVNEHPDGDPVKAINIANPETAPTKEVSDSSTTKPAEAEALGPPKEEEELPLSSSDDDDDDDDDEDDCDQEKEVAVDASERPKDPWNAMVVVGLRVFTRVAKVELKVVTPTPPDEPAVDVDDSAAADAQADVTASVSANLKDDAKDAKDAKDIKDVKDTEDVKDTKGTDSGAGQEGTADVVERSVP